MLYNVPLTYWTFVSEKVNSYQDIIALRNFE
jgi:hypothetical protein